MIDCEFCDEQFVDGDQWKQHMEVVHNSTGFMCSFCPKKFYGRQKYLNHQSAEHGDQLYERHQCSQCGITYKKYKFLERHIKNSHQISILIRCVKCGEEFYNKPAYIKHKKLKHIPGRKFYKCEKCKRSFTAKEMVTLHDKFDHKPDGYLAFRKYIQKHLKLDDRKLLKNLSKCVACNLPYKCSIDLFKHFKTTHKLIEISKCCQCVDVYYNNKTSLIRHLTKEHGLSHGHKCDKCAISYKKLPNGKLIANDKTAELAKEYTRNSQSSKRNINDKEELQFERHTRRGNTESENDNRSEKNDVVVDKPTDQSSMCNDKENNVPLRLDLKGATDKQIRNLRHNIKSMFHMLCTVPTYKLKERKNAYKNNENPDATWNISNKIEHLSNASNRSDSVTISDNYREDDDTVDHQGAGIYVDEVKSNVDIEYDGVNHPILSPNVNNETNSEINGGLIETDKLAEEEKAEGNKEQDVKFTIYVICEDIEDDNSFVNDGSEIYNSNNINNSIENVEKLANNESNKDANFNNNIENLEVTSNMTINNNSISHENTMNQLSLQTLQLNKHTDAKLDSSIKEIKNISNNEEISYLESDLDIGTAPANTVGKSETIQNSISSNKAKDQLTTNAKLDSSIEGIRNISKSKQKDISNNEEISSLNNNVNIAISVNTADKSETIKKLISNKTNDPSLQTLQPITNAETEQESLIIEVEDISNNQQSIETNEKSPSPIKGYSCKFCSIQFSNQVNLLNHLTENHTNLNDNYVCMCIICGTGFCSNESLKWHIRDDHNENFQTRDTTVDKISLLKEHFIMENRDSKQNICDTYKTALKDPNLNENILHDDHNYFNKVALDNQLDKIDTCKECNSNFTNVEHECVAKELTIEDNKEPQNDLFKFNKNDNSKKHVLVSHSIEKKQSNAKRPKNSSKLMCEVCNINFKTTERCLMHKRKAHKTTKFMQKCLKCSDKFSTKGLLLKHIRNKHNIVLSKLYRCEMCTSVFTLEDKLKQHYKLKHDHKPDVKQTENQKPPPVITIKKSTLLTPYKNIDNLKNANIIVSPKFIQEALYKCKACNSYFPSKDLLGRHVKWEHSINVNAYKCGQCGQVLLSIDELEQHNISSHSNIDTAVNWKKVIVQNYEKRCD